jgi:hypothetical protein
METRGRTPMAGKPWSRGTPLEYSDSPLADALMDEAAKLLDVARQVGALSEQVMLRFEPPRQRKRKAAPECDPEAA